MNKFICTNDTLTIVVSSGTVKYRIPDNIGDILGLLMKKKFDEAIDSIDNTKYLIESISNGEIKACPGLGYKIKGEAVPEVVKNLINKFIEEKKPVDGIINMWERLKQMPDDVSLNDKKISRESFFDYLVNACVRILDNGCFIAYKGVREDYKDCHSGRFDNTPGCVPKMKRSECTVDRTQHCSRGLHIGSFQYMKKNYNNGNRWVECMVDPKNVVSVPTDYNHQKMRCCEYKVIRDVTDILKDKDLTFDNVMYEGYVEPLEESTVTEELKNHTEPVVDTEELKNHTEPVDVVVKAKFTPKKKESTSEQIKKVADAQKAAKKKPVKKTSKSVEKPLEMLKTFKVKRISEGRLPITKSILSEIKMLPGDIIGVFVHEKMLIITDPTKKCQFELKVVSDGSVRLSKSIVDKLKITATVFKVQIQKNASNKKIITIKTF